ncbi:MAG: nitroreductase family protein [Pseudomonadota bacterium]
MSHSRGPKDTRRSLQTRFPVSPIIANRWSPRAFDPRMPEASKLGSLFEASRLAPSAHNAQPARFILTRKGQGTGYERLFACLDPKNQVWAHTAPVLALGAVMKRRFSQVKGDFVPYSHFMHDLGLAVMSILLQARAVDLFAHPLAAFDPDQARAAFAVPALYEPAIVLAVGYLGTDEALPQDVRDREREDRHRLPLEEILFEEDWGVASGLLTGPVDAA